MTKFILSLTLLTSSLVATSQETNTSTAKPVERAYTQRHKSFSITYGITTLLGAAPYNTGSTAHSTAGSYAIGPVEIMFNRGLTRDLSMHIGAVGLYHKDSYTYNYENTVYNVKGESNLYLGGASMGFSWHFPAGKRVDPYIGATGGVGHFYGHGGADQLGMRKKGQTVVLYSGKVGVNLYGKKKNAWVIEGGYDYLTYLKIGYALVKEK